MELETAKRLLDAVEAARRIRQFTVGLDLEQFSGSELIRSAVERQFEIIGEALGKAVAADSVWQTGLRSCEGSSACATG